MSILKTYDRPIDPIDDLAGKPTGKAKPWPFVLVEGCGDPDCDPLAPGCWVTHKTWGGYGIIVAITEEQLTVLWSEEPKSLDGFSNIAFPLVRRVFTPLIAQQLVSVQPMTAPVGGIFYLDYEYGAKWDSRCNSGPWVCRMFWRAWRCTSGRTRTCWSSLLGWWRSWSTKKSTPVELDEPLQVDRQRELLTELLKDPDRARKLVDKWNPVLDPATSTPVSPEEADTCPPAALEKTRTSPGT